MSTCINFYSVRKRYMNLTLKLLKDHLETHIDNVSFHYFLENERLKNQTAIDTLRKARRSYTNNVNNAICIDASIPLNFPNGKDGKRIVIFNPYDYQFSDFFKSREKSYKKKKAFTGATHVIVGSPFGKKVLEQCYITDGLTIIDKTPLPLAYDVSSKTKYAQKRQQFDGILPRAKGKKILFLYTSSNFIKNGKPNPFSPEALKSLLDKLGDKWFLVTNSDDILLSTELLPASYLSRIGYMDKNFEANIMYVCDALVTNLSFLATVALSADIPFFALELGNSFFLKYIQEFYPTLCLNIDGLTKLNPNTLQLTQEQQKLKAELTYPNDNNPFSAVEQLFK